MLVSRWSVEKEITLKLQQVERADGDAIGQHIRINLDGPRIQNRRGAALYDRETVLPVDRKRNILAASWVKLFGLMCGACSP